MLSDRRAKILSTIGPSTQSRKGLEKAVFAGMNLARLNFSRGTHDIHAQVVHDLRALSPTWEAPVAILQDLQGPKIRVGRFEPGPILLEEGEKVFITNEDILGKAGLIPTDFKALPPIVLGE